MSQKYSILQEEEDSEALGRSNIIECTFLKDDPETFEEVTLDQLLAFENASLTCNSEDDIWQYYMVKEEGKEEYFVKIKRQIVLDYLDKKYSNEEER